VSEKLAFPSILNAIIEAPGSETTKIFGVGIEENKT